MKLLLILILICVSLHSFSQQTDSTFLKPQKGTTGWHLMKKKQFKTAGFLLLGGGTVLTLASLNKAVTLEVFMTEEEKRKEKAAYTRAWIGFGTMVGSIPFFVAGRSHHKKARMLLKNEKAFLPDPSQRSSFTASAVAFRFKR